MLQAASQARIVMTTASSWEEAQQLARTLMDERLAACVTCLPGALSTYRWQGEVESAQETVILIKTLAEQLPNLESRIRSLHSYQTPELLVLQIEAGSADYLEWMIDTVKRP
jgi:periplasmic divalent cation tolerance protein